MRTMVIPCFAQKVEITDLLHLYKTRLQQKLAPHAAFAIPPLGYMGWPNDGTEREDAMQLLRAWLDGDEPKEFLQRPAEGCKATFLDKKLLTFLCARARAHCKTTPIFCSP